MKKTLLLFCILNLATNIFANQGQKGYIITLGDVVLTGEIKAIRPAGEEAAVVFVNEFGDSFPIHPSLIKGFAYRRDSTIIIYESKQSPEEWQFMQVLVKGSGLNLYRTPEPIIQVVTDAFRTRTYTYHNDQFWLEVNQSRLLPLHRSRYKKDLRRLFRNSAPDLADKIGKPGYRFEDLIDIVQEYNRILALGKVVL